MLYYHCYIRIPYCVLAVADIEIRKIGKSYHFKIEIKKFGGSKDLFKRAFVGIIHMLFYRITSFSDDI